MPLQRHSISGSRILTVLALALAILVIGSSLLGYALFHYRILVQDEWGLYKNFIKQPFWQSLWATHNGHRLFFPGLLQKANLVWFKANLTNLIIFSLVIQSISGWLLAHITVHRLERRSSRWLLTALVLSIMLWMGNRIALVWAFGLTYTLGIFGVVMACYGLFRSACDTSPSLPGKLHWPWFLQQWPAHSWRA
jgi:hypothetical protein